MHFLHIGKTGGTAIKDALSTATADSRYVLVLHQHHIKLNDIPKGEMVVFFLRDPLARFVSGFFSRQRQGRPRHTLPWSPEEKLAFEHFRVPNQLGLALFSRDEEECAKAHNAMKSIYHVSHSYWSYLHSEAYLGLRKEDILFIGLQENLSADFEMLKSKLRLPASLTLPSDDVRAHRNPPELDRSLQKEAVENLKQWYKQDYACLKQCSRISTTRDLGGSIGAYIGVVLGWLAGPLLLGRSVGECLELFCEIV